MSDTQSLVAHRTRRQRVQKWLRSSEPGKPSRRTVVFLYALLALLVFVDYTILTQAFVIIQAEQSTRGSSIGAGQALVVLAISLAAVFLPHAAAWAFQRRHLGILAPYLKWVPWTAISLWLILVLMVTFLRLVAANTVVTVKQDNTADGTGTAAPTEAPPFDIHSIFDFTNSSVVLSYFMLLVLVVSAIMAFIIAVVTHSPLRSSRHAAEANLVDAERATSARTVELHAATEAIEVARGEAGRDAQRFASAQQQLDSRVHTLRAEVRAILAASLGSPEETSRLMREFQREYGTHNPPKGATP